MIFIFLQADFGRVLSINSVITKGRNYAASQMWITSYYVSYSLDDLTWTNVTATNGSTELFIGNVNRDQPVERNVSCPFNARYVRIHPVTYNIHPGLRWGIMACDSSTQTGTSASSMCEQLATCDIFHQLNIMMHVCISQLTTAVNALGVYSHKI